VAEIARSIVRFGFTAPIIPWRSRKQVVAGHGRLLGAYLLYREDPGRKLAPDQPGEAATKAEDGLVLVRWMEFASDHEAAAYAIADNRLTEKNPMVVDLVAQLFSEIKAEGSSLDGLGYGEEELRIMLEPANLPTGDEWGTAMGGLPENDRAPIQQMTFTLHDEQAEMVKRAMEKAKSMGDFVDTGNENSNGNALARVAEMFLGANR